MNICLKLMAASMIETNVDNWADLSNYFMSLAVFQTAHFFT